MYCASCTVCYPDQQMHKHIPYLCKSSVHPFQGFLGPKNQVRIRIYGTLDAHAKSETMILLSVGLL